MGAWPDNAPLPPGFPVLNSASIEALGSGGGGFGNASAVWPTANLAIFVPIRLTVPFLVVAGYIENGTVVSGNVDVGLYSVGGKRLTSKGSTAQAGTNVNQLLTLGTPYLLAPGAYYMALAIDNVTATVRREAPAQVGFARAMGVLQMASAFPLPDPVTFAVATNAYVPDFGLTSRSFA